MRERLVRSENVWMRIPMLADTIHRLKWLIASAPPSKAFATCDAPVIINLQGFARSHENRRREGAYVSVKLTVTVTIASKPIGVYFHCLTASIADWANTPFVDRNTVTSPIVPSA